jgi:hypothetical protein
MKSRFVLGGGIALALAAGAGCVVDNSPLVIGNFHALDQDCAAITDVSVGGGSLDLSAMSGYLVAMDLSSQAAAVPEPVPPQGEVLNGTANEITIDTIEFDYTSGGAAIASGTDELHFVVRPGSVDNWAAIELFGGTAGAEALAAALPGSTISVGIRALGSTRSGVPVSTNRVVFPVFVDASGFLGCAAPSLQATTGPCGRVGGQDGTVVGCCPADATTGAVDRNCLDG